MADTPTPNTGTTAGMTSQSDIDMMVNMPPPETGTMANLPPSDIGFSFLSGVKIMEYLTEADTANTSDHWNCGKSHKRG